MFPKFLKKKWFIGIGCCILLAVIFVLAHSKKSNVLVPTVVTTKGSIVEHAEAVGYVKTSHSSIVKAQVDGTVEEIYHNEGEYVAKNTPLLKIKPAPAPAEYVTTYQNLVDAISQEKNASTNLKRFQTALKEKIITANYSEYLSAERTYNSAKNQRILAEQRLALLDRGETVVGGKAIANVVTSPIDGYILYRNVDVGDPVISISAAQAATALFIVANMQDLMFQGSVDERDAAKIKIDMPASVKIGSLPDQEIMGKVSRVALQSDKENAAQSLSASAAQTNSPFSVGFKVEVSALQFPKDLVLRSGYSATADVKIKKVDNVLTLPLRVIHFKDEKPYVLLPEKKEPKEQRIELGISDDINVEIKSGLKLGDKVIDKPDTTVTTQD